MRNKKAAMVAGLCVAQFAAACDYEDPVVPDVSTCAPPTPESSQRPHFSLLQCPRRRHVGADEPSTPWSPSAAPAAASDLSAAAKQQQTEPRHPETPGPRQVECPKGHAN